ncbi:hypothetical protein A3Q56_06022, partial [Intoshia linei]
LNMDYAKSVICRKQCLRDDYKMCCTLILRIMFRGQLTLRKPGLCQRQDGFFIYYILKAADTQKARINDMSMIFAWESTSTINPIFTRIYNCDKLKFTLHTDYFIKDVKCVKNAPSVNDPA